MTDTRGLYCIRTSSGLYNLLELLTGIQRAEVEHFDHRSSFVQLWGVIGGRCELLQDFSSYTSRRLLHSDNRRVTEITFHKEDHLLIAHKNIVTAYTVQPSLDRVLDSNLIFVCACTGRRNAWRDSGDEGFRVGRNQVLREFDEFGVCSTDIAELCRSKLG